MRVLLLYVLSKLAVWGHTTIVISRAVAEAIAMAGEALMELFVALREAISDLAKFLVEDYRAFASKYRRTKGERTTSSDEKSTT